MQAEVAAEDPVATEVEEEAPDSASQSSPLVPGWCAGVTRSTGQVPNEMSPAIRLAAIG